MDMRLKSPSAVVWFALVALGCTAQASPGRDPQEKPPSYAIHGEQAEGCECESVCPCVWEKDVTFQDCRGILAWHVAGGSYGGTDLKGVTFCVALAKTGKNVVQTMGKWEGTIYVSDTASEAQKRAAVGFLSGRWGKAFGKIDVKSAPIEFKADGERREVTIGKVATLKIAGIKGSGGRVPAIENPPFALIPKLSCAVAETHTYDDGTSKWDFKGRNGFYGPFLYKSE
jgi:hypothetical protein